MLIGLFMVVLSADPASSVLTPALDVRLQDYWISSFDRPAEMRRSEIRRRYATDPAVERLADGCTALAEPARRDLFRATRVANFYLQDPRLVERLQCLLTQMDADGTATALDYRQLHGALLAQRRFAEANALRREQALDVAQLPDIHGQQLADRRQVLQLRDAGHAEVVTLPDQGWSMIVVVHPYCGFSKRATAALATDPRFADLRGRLQLVLPDDQGWPVQAVLAWNREHPALPMQPLLRSTAWHGIEFGSTPAFYLTFNGKVVDHASGWADTGSEIVPLLDRLRRADAGQAAPSSPP